MVNFWDFLISKDNNNKTTAPCIQTLQLDRWSSRVWVGTWASWPLRSSLSSHSYWKSFVILTLTSLTERPSGSTWNPNMCCLYSVPCCFTVIRSPRNTSFWLVLGSIQFGPLACAHQHKATLMPFLSSVSERPLVWILSFLSFSFDLFLFPVSLIFVLFCFYSLSLPQLFLPALLLRCCFIWQSSCLCLLSVSYRCALPHPAAFFFWESLLRPGVWLSWCFPSTCAPGAGFVCQSHVNQPSTQEIGKGRSEVKSDGGLGETLSPQINK